MGNKILIIAFASPERLFKKEVSWTGSHLDLIMEFTNINTLSANPSFDGIAYFTGKINSNQPAYKISVQNIIVDKKRLLIYYDILEKLEITSVIVWKSLRDALTKTGEKLLNLPFCAVIDQSHISSTIETQTTVTKLKKLIQQNNWQAIIDMFPPLDKLEDYPYIWNNQYLLNSLGFATAKLSETTINLKRQFPDEKQRKSYLKEKAQFRNATLKIRNRLIELDPQNPSYYSNLAYTHYQHCLELSTPGGRRDGSIKTEAEKALQAFDNALSLDPSRITDNYRKGRLLVRILAPNFLFTEKNLTFETFKQYQQLILQSIDSLKNAERLFESIPITDEKPIIRYKKEYIKTLYNLAYAYSQLIPSFWNYLHYLPNTQTLPHSLEISDLTDGKTISIQIKDQTSLFSLKNILQFRETMKKSIFYIEKCIFADTNQPNQPDLVAEASKHSTLDAVLKLYTAGKYSLNNYLLLKTIEKNYPAQFDNSYTEELDHASKAENLFTRALKVKWQENSATQSKAFIAEKLARLYIATSRPQLASQTLKPFLKKCDYYIRYTAALAAFLSGDTNLAYQQLQLALQDKRNLDRKTGEILLTILKTKSPKN